MSVYSLLFSKKRVTFGESSVIDPQPKSAVGVDTNPFSPANFALRQPKPLNPNRSVIQSHNTNSQRLLDAFNNLKISADDLEEKKEATEAQDKEDKPEDRTQEPTETKEVIEKVQAVPEDWENIIFPELENYLREDGMDTWAVSEWMRRVRQEYAKILDFNYLEVFHYILHHVTHGVQPPKLAKYFPDDAVRFIFRHSSSSSSSVSDPHFRPSPDEDSDSIATNPLLMRQTSPNAYWKKNWTQLRNLTSKMKEFALIPFVCIAPLIAC